jgi:adenylate kinase family enzyme
MKSGKLQPEFLAIWMWSHHFIEDLKENEHIVIDGTPRALNEAKVLDNALAFYKREKPIIIFINVSRDWSKRHLLARGRTDDVTDDIEARLNWYETDVQPAVEFFRAHPMYDFVSINGEQTIEEVHQS